MPPISDKNSAVLILGTMPGAESLKQQAYYSHQRNLFWKIIREIIQSEVPATYDEKKKFLLQNKIALWDMCKACIREGSLDSNISHETPNDIADFTNRHPNLKAIAFNGKEAAKLFDKHIGSIPDIKLFVLPSTSPANAYIDWKTKIYEWSRLKTYIT